MNRRSVGVRRGGLIVLAVGLLLLVPGVIALVSSVSFFGKAERAEAVFGGAVLRNSSYGMMYYPEFTFRTKDGRDMTFRFRIGSSDQEYAPGAKIAVLYDPIGGRHALRRLAPSRPVTAAGASGGVDRDYASGHIAHVVRADPAPCSAPRARCCSVE
jgi:hypothetical protein